MSESANVERQEQAQNRQKMNKRATTKDDGRQLIYYTFGTSLNGSDNKDDRSKQPEDKSAGAK